MVDSGRRCLSIAGIVIAAISLIVPAPASANTSRARNPTNWSQLGFDATRRSLNPFETILDPSTVSGLQLQWSTAVGGEQNSPIEADGTVFTVSYENGALTAVDAATGHIDWQVSVGSSLWLAPPAVSGGRVFTGSGDTGFFYALDEASGDLLWKIPTSAGETEGPALVDGTTLYVAAGDTLYAIDAATGSVLWTQTPTRQLVLAAAPAVANGIVYQTDEKGKLHAYAADTGTGLWTTVLAAKNEPLSAPAVDGARVLVTGTAGQLWSVDAATGSVQWEVEAHADSSPGVANGMVYVYSRLGNPPILLTAFDEDTGDLLWSGRMGAGRTYGFPDGPSVANGVVYAGSFAGGVMAFDATTGAPLWVYRLMKQTVEGTPVVVDGQLYVTALDDLVVFGLGG